MHKITHIFSKMFKLTKVAFYPTCPQQYFTNWLYLMVKFCTSYNIADSCFIYSAFKINKINLVRHLLLFSQTCTLNGFPKCVDSLKKCVCPSNMVYQQCKPCKKTCNNLSPVCPAICIPGCGCPAKTPVWLNGKCVKESQCMQHILMIILEITISYLCECYGYTKQVQCMQQLIRIYIHVSVMYKLRFCTSCNLYKKSAQVATCKNSLYKLQLVRVDLYKLQLVQMSDLYKLQLVQAPYLSV